MEKIYRVNSFRRENSGVLIADDFHDPNQTQDETFKKDVEEIDRFLREHTSVSTIGALKRKYIGEFLQILSGYLSPSSFEQVKSFYESETCKKLLTWGPGLQEKQAS